MLILGDEKTSLRGKQNDKSPNNTIKRFVISFKLSLIVAQDESGIKKK